MEERGTERDRGRGREGKENGIAHPLFSAAENGWAIPFSFPSLPNSA